MIRRSMPQDEPPDSLAPSGGRYPTEAPTGASSGAVNAQLFVSAPEGPAVFSLEAGQLYTLGRGESADIIIQDASISRQHATLRVGACVDVEDLGSRNGTWVFGEKLKPGQVRRIAVGETITMGGTSMVIATYGRAADGLALPDAAAGTAKRSGAQPRGVPAGAAARDSAGGPAKGEDASDQVVVASRELRALYDGIDVIAAAPLNVLVLGETGVGKDVYANEVHRRSPRGDRPFFPINCAALSETMLEAELFGFERGAFTGAVKSKQGLFEAADGGTVFLDEIGDMSLGMQAKLLRVLESGEVLRIGSVRSIRVDVRIIAATHRDLQIACAEGTFRSDLYFRIDGFTVTVPPLRDRPEDVPALANYFARRACARAGRAPVTFAPDAVLALVGCSWPGNVRELRNVIERAVMVARGEVVDRKIIDAVNPRQRDPLTSTCEVIALTRDAAGFPSFATSSPPKGEVRIPYSSIAPNPVPSPPMVSGENTLWDDVHKVERDRIVQALEQCGGNQSHAARLVGISRHTLMSRMDRYGISRPRKG